MKPPAYLLMSVSKILPERVRETVQIFNQGEYRKDCQQIRGLRQALLIESQEEPGRMIWLSTWDRMADFQAFLNSPFYANLMTAMQPYLLRVPEWYWYRVLVEMTRQYRRKDHQKEAIFE